MFIVHMPGGYLLSAAALLPVTMFCCPLAVRVLASKHFEGCPPNNRNEKSPEGKGTVEGSLPAMLLGHFLGIPCSLLWMPKW